MNETCVKAMFKISRHNILSIFIISQDYYELHKRTIQPNGNIYHIFRANNFSDIQILYQDKTSIDMTLNESKLLTSTSWNEKYQTLTIDMTKDRYQGRYRLGLQYRCIPDTSPF